MTDDEHRPYAKLMFKKDSLVSSSEAKKAQIAKLIADLRVIDREQDEWIAVFSLHHDVDVDVKQMKVDVINATVVLRWPT